MAWWIVYVGIVCLGAIALRYGCEQAKERKTSRMGSGLMAAPLTNDKLCRLVSIILQQQRNGRRKLSLSPSCQRRLGRLFKKLQSTPDEDLLPGLKWLTDHGRLMESACLSLQAELKQLPPLPALSRRETAVRRFARAVFSHSQGRITGELIVRCLTAANQETPFTLAELWAVPLALRCVLLDFLLARGEQLLPLQMQRNLGLKLAGKLLANSRRARKQLYKTSGSTALWEAVLSALHRNDRDEHMTFVQGCLDRGGLNSEALLKQELNRQTVDQMWLGNAVTSLKRLEKINWTHLLEAIDPLDAQLRRDSVYGQMDAPSRGYYRSRVQALADRLNSAETDIARAAADLSLSGHPDGVHDHVGHYLLENDGMACLSKRLKVCTFRFSLYLFCRRHSTLLYRAVLCLGALLGVTLSFYLDLPLALHFPFGVVFSRFTRMILKLFLRRLIPVSHLPKLHIEKLSKEQQTLVVCPTLLSGPQEAIQMARHLSVLFHGNPDAHLHFMLLGDFADSPTPSQAADRELIAAASEAVEALNQTLPGKFIYYQRERTFNPGQQTYMGRERKRGALESLNLLLTGQPAKDRYAYQSIPIKELAHEYAHVITLDSDTLLPPGEALRLVGAIAHPLQKRMELNGHRRGVSIIAPRMETLPSMVASRLSRYWAGPGGVNTYNGGLFDLYQDLCRRGSYCGKGIYRPADLLSETAPYIPENAVLSHDLLEGELAGCAYASDIVLYDSHPSSLSGWMKRLHRWTRGDWQLLPWLLPAFSRVNAPLDSFSRHKLWDNLRRSLLPLCQIILLGWCVITQSIPFMAGILLLTFLPFSYGTFIEAALLPYRVFTLADAVARTLWRLTISRKHLLDWIPSHLKETPGTSIPSGVIAQWVTGGLFAGYSLLPPCVFGPGFILGLGYLLAPFAINWLEKPPVSPVVISSETAATFKQLAASTWRFFEETVTAADHFLPPDNRQTEPDVGLAHRTSPTNMGFYLLSLICAEALDLISTDAMARRMNDTLTTLERLSKWQGHFYNWYDTQTLRVLEPAYVSAVDSGNLCACLLCAAQALRTLAPGLPNTLPQLAHRLDQLAYAMDLGALFDPEAGLFYVGFNANEMVFTDAHYDLMASEARLVSFVGVITGHIPSSHWYKLSRFTARVGRSTVLLSWSGTMFEYLMPHLLLPLYPNALLERTCKGVVKAQMKRKFQRVWGISESGYYAFDPQLNYQYKAFGLPQLALGPGLGDQVISPYASALAASLFPRKTAANLERMMEMDWGCTTGLYEAADFSGHCANAQLVKSQMAHHQGMLLCALTNGLTGQLLHGYLMALPAAQAWQLLLEEPAPRKAPRRRVPVRASRTSSDSQVFDVRVRRLTLPARAQVLHGRSSTLFTDMLGNGYMASGEQMLNRFSFRASRKEGLQFYLKDLEKDILWQPTNGQLKGETVFSSGCTVFRREYEGVVATLTCWVDPITDSFLHLLELDNLKDNERTFEAASYFVPTLLNAQDDLAHPAFRELFLEATLFSEHTLLVRRRPGTASEAAPILAHSLRSDSPIGAVAWETDRSVFLGRDGDVKAPAAMQQPMKMTAPVTAPVNPCVSARCQITLPAKGRVRLLFVTHLFEEKDYSPQQLEERYVSPNKALPSLKLAETKAVAASRFAGLAAKDYKCLLKLLPLLVYGGSGSDKRLWLVRYHHPNGRTLLKQCAKLHRYLRLQGIPSHLTCVAASQDMMDTLEGISKDFEIRCREQMTEEMMTALEAEAVLILDDSEGTLTQQLGTMLQPSLCDAPSATWPAPPPVLPVIKKQFDNGWGGFTLPSGDYAIDLPNDQSTPAPWCQLLAEPHLGTLVCERGPLFTWQGNSHNRRLSPWSNDPVAPRPSEGFWLTDLDENCICTPVPSNKNAALNYRVTYSPGMAEYHALGFGLNQTLTLWTDPDLPVSIRRWKVKNTGTQPRRLRLSHYVHFILGVQEKDDRYVTITLNGDALFACSPQFDGLACLSLLEGEALYQTLPAEKLHCITDASLPCEPGPVAIAHKTVTLLPGAGCEAVFLLSAPVSTEGWQAQLALLRAQGVSARLRLLNTRWHEQISPLQFQLPDDALQLMMNRWLPYQVRAARLNARAGFYQAGGAIGFRDQLQDMISLIHTQPDRVRAHLLDCAAHQFEAGDVQHWWHPPRRGVRTRISDDLLFLPYVTAWYVRVTEDHTILDEPVPYLAAEPLSEIETDRYDAPSVTDYQETLRQHCLKAIEAVDLGGHGMPLMKDGDWNDGMNQVGGQRGESVWLGFFFAAVLKAFAPYAQEKEAALLKQAHQLQQNLDAFGWDGQWYLRAFKHNGETVGSHENHACRIDCLAQSWAVLAGMPRQRCAQGLDAAWHMLYNPQLGIMKLLDPPFSPADGAGYIGGYLPGIRENGGQYTHAVPWFIWAMIEMGWSDRAWELVQALLPIHHASTPESARCYRVEPYVMAGDVYTHPEQAGRGGWTFYTGSAGWLYTVVLEKLLGFEHQGNRCRLRPRVPTHWNSFTITWQRGESTYHLTACEAAQPELDGETLPDGWILLVDDGKIHQAQFPIR